jgi:hypothetical protein
VDGIATATAAAATAAAADDDEEDEDDDEDEDEDEDDDEEEEEDDAPAMPPNAVPHTVVDVLHLETSTGMPTMPACCGFSWDGL